MREEEVHIPVQLCHGLINVRDHRVTRHICAGHDEQGVFQMGEEQVVKSGIRQHAADRMQIAYCGMSSRITFFYDNNRMDRAFQVLVLLTGNSCQPVNIIRAHHDGKRLFDSAQTAFQFIGRFFNARQVKSPHTTHCKDPARIEQFCCLPDRVQTFNLVSEGIGEFDLRPAGPAGDCLGMVAPATRIPVFLCTVPDRKGILPWMSVHGRTVFH